MQIKFQPNYTLGEYLPSNQADLHQTLANKKHTHTEMQHHSPIQPCW